jgi:hypothetical protein
VKLIKELKEREVVMNMVKVSWSEAGEYMWGDAQVRCVPSRPFRTSRMGMIICLQDDTDNIHMENKCDQLGSIIKSVPMMEHNPFQSASINTNK